MSLLFRITLFTSLLIFLQVLSARASEVTIHYPERLSGAAEEIKLMIPEIQKELSESFMIDVKDITVVLPASRREFLGISRNPMVSAVAIPERGLIVIDYSKMRDYFTLKITLKHELCHLYVHRLSAGHAPRWLNEGVCQWITAGISELLYGTKEDLLRRAAQTGQLIPLRELKSFPRQPQLFSLAYEQSKSFVGFLIKRNGVQAIVELLRKLKGGTSLDRAISDTYGATLHELEKEWHKQLKGFSAYIRFFTEHLYEILFFAAAVLAVVGFCRVLFRKRRLDDMEEEDQLWQ